MRLDLPFPGCFTTAMASDVGLDARQLRLLVRRRSLTHVLTGVYLDGSFPVDLDRKIEAVSLVLPPGGVVVDRTAAWMHGLDVLRRSAVFEVPPVDAFVADGTRMRRGGVSSGRRGLLSHDVEHLGDVPVTTRLRTSLGLARLMWRYDALGAIDQFLALGVSREEMLAELPRFRGFRWVTQARALIPLGDPRAESMPESALRLHWHETLRAAPQPQLWVQDDDGRDVFRLDVADEKMRYAAEYNGVEHHSSSADTAYDAGRRAWLHGRGWKVDDFTSASIYGFSPHPSGLLLAGWERARARHGLLRW